MNWDVFLHYFEYVAAAIAFSYVIFQILQKPLMWYLSILAAMAYLTVYLHNGLYAMAGVQGYLIVAGIYGLLDWTRSKKKEAGTENQGKIMIRPFEWKVGLISIPLAVGIFFFLHFLLAKVAPAGAPAWQPWVDALLATNTILATFYTGRRYIISWVMWFVFDIIAVIIYLKLGMYPTAALFTCYVVMAVIGFFNWKKNGVWEKDNSVI